MLLAAEALYFADPGVGFKLSCGEEHAAWRFRIPLAVGRAMCAGFATCGRGVGLGARQKETAWVSFARRHCPDRLRSTGPGP